MIDVTARQLKVLRFMVSFQREHGWPPTLREVGRHMGIASTNGVNDHMRALERKGLLELTDMKSRARKVTEHGMRTALNGYTDSQAVSVRESRDLGGEGPTSDVSPERLF